MLRFPALCFRCLTCQQIEGTDADKQLAKLDLSHRGTLMDKAKETFRNLFSFHQMAMVFGYLLWLLVFIDKRLTTHDLPSRLLP
jgi:hypothetical protein